MKIISAIFTILFAFFSAGAIAQNQISPIGYWKTVDDKTGEILSIVHIYPAHDGLEGKVVRIMPVQGQTPTDVCKRCRGEQANQPIMGMKVISGMIPIASNQWGRGRMLDPKSGNIYRGKMTLIDNNRLNVRGYVAIPALGRTETWIRTDKP